MGVRFKGREFGVQGLGLRVQGLGFGVSGLTVMPREASAALRLDAVTVER